MPRTSTVVITTLLILCLPTGCATSPRSESGRAYLHARVLETMDRFLMEDPGLQAFFEDAHGFAVIPAITKGAVAVGGAYGKGEVYELDEFIGFCDMTQGTVGLQLGGQSYSELIFFADPWTLERFVRGDLTFSARLSAVAVTAGAAAGTDYLQGVAVFTLPRLGLMVEASVGGQKFGFEPW